MMSDRTFMSMDSRRFYLALGCMILVAWGLLFSWQRSVYAELLSHEVIEDNSLPPLLRLATFLLSWFLMTVAMMLPGSLPLLNQSAQPNRGRFANSMRAGLVILGYLSPWVLFGLLVYLGDNILHHIAEPGAPLSAFSGLIAPVIVLTAGLYQFTPGKRRFTTFCQSSSNLFMQNCEKLNGAKALIQGLQLGVLCVGSCWSLMLLMFALGHNRLGWMLVLGGIMAAERLTPWGHRLSRVVGLVLVVWATLLGLTSLRIGL